MSEAVHRPQPRKREDIPAEYRWDLTPIFNTWSAWEVTMSDLESRIGELTAFQGTLGEEQGKRLLAFLRLHDEVSTLSYRVWYYPSLEFDTDQRNNDIDAKRQRVQELFAKFNAATSWYSPEVLSLGVEKIRTWMENDRDLALYRFALEELFRQAEHILDEKGEHLLALSSRFSENPSTTYQMLSTADVEFREVELSTGETVTVTPGAYRSLLSTLKDQQDREKVFRAHYELFEANLNTYSSIYSGVMQKGWFHAQSRNYLSVLEANLHGDHVPVSVVETLVDTARAHAAPLRKYHQLRKRILGLEKYHLYDGFVSLVDLDSRYPYETTRDLIIESVKPLGDDYVQLMEKAFTDRWIDVYENEGKRSGAYSAGVYGVHPYMLLNYQDTLDDVFTLAHELGHTLHTLLSDRAQPFVYSQYTIFVAEVASTMNEALLLDTLLKQTENPVERALLLQHAIDGIVGTFYTQSLFADFELQAHRLVESGQPVTSEVLNQIYMELLNNYYGDAMDREELYRVTWARIPHFFQSPYYVYQYATSYASSARIFEDIQRGDSGARTRYLDLLKAGGSDHPIDLLKRAGADLNDVETVKAVTQRLDELVQQLERELSK